MTTTSTIVYRHTDGLPPHTSTIVYRHPGTTTTPAR